MAVDPKLIGYITKAAAKHGADPVALLATALQESGGQPGRVGDQGTSFGYYQFHVGGALPRQYWKNPFPYADSYDVVDNRARLFAAGNVHGGAGAAAIQRPANRGAYASGVDAKLAEARALLGGGAGAIGAGTGTITGAPSASTGATGAGQSAAYQAARARRSTLQSLMNANAKLFGIPSLRLPQVTAPAAGAPDPPGFKVSGELPASSSGQQIVNVAKQYIGTKYVWGGESPQTGFDCSGLVQWAAAKAGKKLPRTTYEQWRVGAAVPRGALQPGDSVFFHPGSRGPEHMGIYIGNNQFLEAPRTGLNVRISNLSGRSDYMGARRN